MTEHAAQSAFPSTDDQPPQMQSEQRAPQPSVAQSCHADALHCIFAFLSLKELLPALHSCRNWLAAGCKERSRGRHVHLDANDGGTIASLAASPLRHHVKSITTEHPMCLRLDQLRQLRSLPSLTDLHLRLDVADLRAALQSVSDSEHNNADANPFRPSMPQRLRTLVVRFHSDEMSRNSDTALRQSVVDALPDAPALSDLRLNFECKGLDLAPLLRLTSLTSLGMKGRPSLPQCAALGQLGALTNLHCGEGKWSAGALAELCAPGRSRLQRLQLLNLSSTSLSPSTLSSLQHLHALTALQPREVSPSCWASLGGFVHLRSLLVDCFEQFSPEQLASLGVALNSLKRLTSLTLRLRRDRYLDGPAIALVLPSIRQLCLDRVRLPSLSFLQHSPQLAVLQLHKCFDMSADDVMECLRVHAPPRLRQLELHWSVRLSAEQKSALRPPSSLLPKLQQFTLFCDPI